MECIKIKLSDKIKLLNQAIDKIEKLISIDLKTSLWDDNVQGLCNVPNLLNLVDAFSYTVWKSILQDVQIVNNIKFSSSDYHYHVKKDENFCMFTYKDWYSERLLHLRRTLDFYNTQKHCRFIRILQKMFNSFKKYFRCI